MPYYRDKMWKRCNRWDKNQPSWNNVCMIYGNCNKSMTRTSITATTANKNRYKFKQSTIHDTMHAYVMLIRTFLYRVTGNMKFFSDLSWSLVLPGISSSIQISFLYWEKSRSISRYSAEGRRLKKGILEEISQIQRSLLFVYESIELFSFNLHPVALSIYRSTKQRHKQTTHEQKCRTF